MADSFEDGLLDARDALLRYDEQFRWLAESGARVRIETEAAATAVAALDRDLMPRAIVAAGRDARLLRAVLEPWCPVPFVAWPGPGLPGWAGSNDLVVVLDPSGTDAEAASSVDVATRRGCVLVTACPDGSSLAERAAARYTTLLPTRTPDPLAVAVVMLQALHRIAVGPEIHADAVADVLDAVAVDCSPYRDIGSNPGKDLAIALADCVPLMWGGSVLAARAARRVAEAFRRTSGRPALAADARHLLPVLTATTPRDLFADPDDGSATSRPGLLILDDGNDQVTTRVQRGRLATAAGANGVTVQTIPAMDGAEIARYAALLTTGSYAALYLGVGLRRADAATEQP
ncbi:MAG TPA: SIS domain-containing protein [Nocardioidaceae bacterium]|nr:SIS domain-containing protein [Nocardioidaceae bacterium]